MAQGKRRNSGGRVFTGLICVAAAAALTFCAVKLYDTLYVKKASPPENGQSGTEEPSGGEENPQPEQLRLFEEYYGKAADTLKGMTLAEKVGQLFLVRCPKEGAAEAIRQYQPGGFVLFANDFDKLTESETTAKLTGYQADSKIPMILAVDEEGGTVVRVSKNPNLAKEPFKSPQELYALGGLDAIRADAENKAELLKRLGINLNLAPVADVSANSADYIYPRTLGKSATETSEYIAAVVEKIKEKGLSCTLKHFPGYGNNANTHEEVAVDKRPYSEFETSDFLPFKAGIESGAQSVMVSHNVVISMDETLPASLSPKVHEILRNELKFTGVVMTDDLSMEAVKLFVKNQSPAVLAVKAGNDMLVITDFQKEYEVVLAAVKSGEISEQRIDESVLRILAWKYSMGLLS